MNQHFQKKADISNLVEEKLGNNLELIGTIKYFLNRTPIGRH